MDSYVVIRDSHGEVCSEFNLQELRDEISASCLNGTALSLVAKQDVRAVLEAFLHPEGVSSFSITDGERQLLITVEDF